MTAWRHARALVSALGTALSTLAAGRARARVEVKPGDVAPDFTLAASDGRTYRLSDLRGRVVVIAWFPKAFTAGCTMECKSLGLSKAALGAFDAAIFAASCDTVDTNRSFAASTGIDFPILSDPETTVASTYGVLGPLGLPSRCTVYVATDGRILAVDREVRVSNHGADIAQALERFGVSRRP